VSKSVPVEKRDDAGVHPRPGEGVAGKVFATGEPAWIPDVRACPDFPDYGGAAPTSGRSCASPSCRRGRTSEC